MRSVRAEGKLVILGVIQEHHADRCRLFAQWKNLDWPILHDPVNQLGPAVVPIAIAIDERGIVQMTRATPDQVIVFTQQTPAESPNSAAPVAHVPELAQQLAQAREANTAEQWIEAGDTSLIWHDDPGQALTSYQRALAIQPENAATHFRLATAYRIRHESDDRLITDFAQAAAHWEAALRLNPNQYIYRRRIEQYGPRMIKPYPFYSWIARARSEIRDRGETPVTLRTEPSGAELAEPAHRTANGQPESSESPDPDQQIARDTESMIEVAVAAVPPRIRSNASAQCYVHLSPTDGAKWNNEAGPLLIWLDLPSGWQSDQRLHALKGPAQAESTERREVSFELTAPDNFVRPVTVQGCALYHVCTASGTCQYLRQPWALTLSPLGSAKER